VQKVSISAHSAKEFKSHAIFWSFFPPEHLVLVVRETNKFGTELLNEHEGYTKVHLHCRLRQSKPVTEKQLKCWFGMVLNIGLNFKRDEKSTWAQCFPTSFGFDG
jgi:hypothetical protein